MDKLIHKLVEVNISKGKISNEEAEIFTYGYRLLVEKILIFLISIFVAALCDAFFEIVLLYISFVPLRTYCGGYHAKSSLACMILSGVFLTLGIYGIRIMEYNISIELFVLEVIICGLVLMKFAPIDVKQKKITDNERIFFKKVMMIVFIVECFDGIILILMEKVIYASSIFVSFFLCVFFLAVELVRKRIIDK